ncbi:MAG: flagellar biosynthesis protein FlhF [Gemmatimonadetes bacterium]|jgi:flagellar biosynthesis protein FlhF|nr:flagellar biosynthesis protein FlhF [Gemmatimonadota bacterium]
MKIRKFAAPSVPQALRQVRDELGEDAVILNTRQVPGEDGGQQVEITAAIDAAVAAPASAAAATAVAEPPARGDLLGRTYGRSAPGAEEAAPAFGSRPRWEQDQPVDRLEPGPRSGSLSASRSDSRPDSRDASRRGLASASPGSASWLAGLPKVPRQGGPEAAERISAAIRDRVGNRTQAPNPTTESTTDAPGDTPAQHAAIPTPAGSPAPGVTSTDPTETGAPVLRRLRQIEDAVRHMSRHSSSLELPAEVARLGERLRRVGVSEDLTRGLMPKVLRSLGESDQDNREIVCEVAANLLYDMLPERIDLRIGKKRKVVAFVGPSGSGKTTAVAKIAAGFVKRRRRRNDYQEGEIAIISTDTQRVGALAQARAYADLIGVPLEDAHDAADLERALAKHAGARLILIDTAGIGPHEVKQREQLRGLLDTAAVDEVQVVLDGRTGYDHMLDVLEVCDGEQPRRLLLSKMDEAMHPGAALSAAIAGSMPSSYYTTGPAIPGGICPGDLRRLVDWVVGRCPSPFAPAG